MRDTIIAVDPGRDKCGIAILKREQGVLEKMIIATPQLAIVVEKKVLQYGVSQIVIGDGTTSKAAIQRLSDLCTGAAPMQIIVVDERYTTEQARVRYWQENPPRGLKRLLPVSMQVPPVPVDDYVAVILAERYLTNKSE